MAAPSGWSRYPGAATPASFRTAPVWALPRSLTTTRGIECFFLFLEVLRCFSSPGSRHPPYVFRRVRLGMTPAGFPHSDIPGSVLGCQLPRAYRRLPRPSSAPDAKASTECPSSLAVTNSEKLATFTIRVNCVLLDARARYGVLKGHATSPTGRPARTCRAVPMIGDSVVRRISDPSKLHSVPTVEVSSRGPVIPRFARSRGRDRRGSPGGGRLSRRE